MESSSLQHSLLLPPECVICQDIFFQPVTLPCGHSYCRVCINQSLSLKPLCPTCRVPLLGSARNLSQNFTLQSLLETQFPKEYAQKRQAQLSSPSVSINSTEPSYLLSSERQQQPTLLTNMLIIRQTELRYLFPKTTIDFSIPTTTLNNLLVHSLDKRVVIEINENTADNSSIAVLCQLKPNQTEVIIPNSPLVLVKMMISNRVLVKARRQIVVSYTDLPNQQVSTSNNNTTEEEQEPRILLPEGFSFDVCDCEEIDDSGTSEGSTAALISENAALIINQISQILAENDSSSFTNEHLHHIISSQNLNAFLQPRYLNSTERAAELCWITSTLFAFTTQERARIWHASSLIERTTLVAAYLKKFTGIKNVSSIFDIQAPGQTKSNHQHWFILAIFLALIFAKLIAN